MSIDSLWIAYWSLRDPLCQSQVLPVARGLAATGYRLGVMTFEQDRWALSTEETAEAGAALARQGIKWMPRRYHRHPKALSTMADALGGAFAARRSRPRLYHARGTMPAAVAYAASRRSGSRFLNDADGPLSQEYVDAGVWRSGSLLPRLVSRAEEHFMKLADASAVLTTLRANDLQERFSTRPSVVPCAVDCEHFSPRPRQGRELRHQLSLDGTVFAYAGKAGGWYLLEPMIDFVAAYRESCGPATLLVLTPGDGSEFTKAAASRGVPCRVGFATREDMPAHLSACDVGLSFRLATPSQRAASPIKNGEYLACGLPVVTTAGVGDYSSLIADKRVGVVVDKLDPDHLRSAAGQLRSLLGEAGLTHRCREAARSHAGLGEVVLPRFRALYERLLGPPRAAS